MEVQPNTGSVIPDANGMGPTNANNLMTANTAKDLQSQADATAVKENRAGKPASGASTATQVPITYKGNFKNNSIDSAALMFGNVPKPVPPPTNFNSGLRKASASGKLDDNPSFKEKVDAAPITKKNCKY
tara:strand:- start:1377 stop:1766 length:390 start_codon:yes stop_codon:yes gene_type:complete